METKKYSKQLIVTDEDLREGIYDKRRVRLSYLKPRLQGFARAQDVVIYYDGENNPQVLWDVNWNDVQRFLEVQIYNDIEQWIENHEELDSDKL
jgi:hypothetical protein